MYIPPHVMTSGMHSNNLHNNLDELKCFKNVVFFNVTRKTGNEMYSVHSHTQTATCIDNDNMVTCIKCLPCVDISKEATDWFVIQSSLSKQI